jgi:peptidoglycan/LPS O-acetylase OafA/YrhL
MATTTDAPRPDPDAPIDAEPGEPGDSDAVEPAASPWRRAWALARSPFGLGVLAVAAVGLAWRAFYILTFKREPGACGDTLLCGDAIYYHAQAGLNAAGGFFEDPTNAGFPAADHPPLTALVLTPVAWLTDSSVLAMRGTMALIGTVTIVVLALLGRKVAGNAAGIATAAVAAANPNLWMNDGLVMSESIATLGIAASLLGLYRFRERPSWGRAAALGALLGLTMLARAEMALFIPLAVLPVALWLRDLCVGQRLGRFLVVGLVAAAVVAPWSVWNTTRFAEPVLLSTNDGITLVGANCDTTYYTGGIGFWDLGCAFAADGRVEGRAGLDQSEVSAAYRDQAVDFVRANTGQIPSVAWHRLLRVWNLHQPHQMVWLNKGEGRETWASWWGVWFSWMVLPFAAWGALLLRRRDVAVWPLLSTVVIVSFTAVAFYGIVRFRLPADVAFCALAGVALAEVWRRWRASRLPAGDADGDESPSAAGTAATPDGEADGRAVLPEPGTDPHDPIAARPATPEVSGGAHFPALDAYRGIGMTMVLLNHAAYATGFIQRGVSGDGTAVESALAPFIARTDISVPMFFVMSGFLLFRPFAGRTLAGREPGSARTFYRRRVLRIIPAYWVALVGIGIIFGLHIASALGWIGNALLLPAFGVPVQVCTGDVCRVGYGITQAWSIGVEATFYLLVPAFAWAVHRLVRRHAAAGRFVGLLVALGAVYLAGVAFRVFVVTAQPSWSGQSLLWLPMYLDLFAIGMTLAVLSAGLSHGWSLPRALGWLGDHPALCWLGAGVVFVAMTRLSPPAEPFGLNGAEYLPRQFLYGVASALWLWPALFGDQTKGRLRRTLASRPLVYLGGISLSFYLWHLVLIEQAKAWTVPDYEQLQALAANPPPDNPLAGLATFTGNFFVVAALAWIVSFLVASLLFRVVELPFLRLKDEPLRALFRRDGPSTPATDGRR